MMPMGEKRSEQLFQNELHHETVLIKSALFMVIVSWIESGRVKEVGGIRRGLL